MKAARVAEEVPSCPACHRPFRIDAGADPRDYPCCGRPLCRARTTWTPAQWAARASMIPATGPRSEFDSWALQLAPTAPVVDLEARRAAP